MRCGQGDNLMVHAAMAALQPGEVLVLTMPEPAPVALFGDLLATQAQARGAAAVLVDAAVRDVEELAELGLPMWARWVRVAGRGQGRRRASSTCRSTVGGATIRPGDLVVLDADGVAVVAAERVDEVLDAPRASARRRSAVKREKLAGGALSYDLDGLRAKVEGAARERDRPPRAGRAAHARRRRRACAFFVDVLGMEVEGAATGGPSTCAAGATTSATASS